MKSLVIWYCLKCNNNGNGSYPVFFESVELYRLVKEQDTEHTYSESDFLTINTLGESDMWTTDVMEASSFIADLEYDLKEFDGEDDRSYREELQSFINKAEKLL